MSLQKVLIIILLFMSSIHAVTGDPVLINEILASHTGADNTEYIELYGVPGQHLMGLSLIIIESDRNSTMGNIDRRIDFSESQFIGSNGFFLMGNPEGLAANYSVTPNATIANNFLENSSLTAALVETKSLGGGSVTGEEIVHDAITIIDSDIQDTTYFDAPVVGPDGTYFPAGVRRLIDGMDTDQASDWDMGDFYLGPENTPTSGDKSPPPSPPIYSIMEIQGNEQYSSLTGKRVETHGIVTLFSANGRNFWIQDPLGDEDLKTSDGIFVAAGFYSENKPKPEIGDYIQIWGQVQELQFGSQLPLTRIRNIELIVIESKENPLPTAFKLTKLPDVSIPEGIVFWESLEGMRISIDHAPVVSPTSKYGEFALLAPGNAKRSSGFIPFVKQIFLRKLCNNAVDYNPERILVDDFSLKEMLVVRPGDLVKSMNGVVDYTYGNFKIQPENIDILKKPLPKGSRISRRFGMPGRVKITSFNVENLFDLIDNPNKDDNRSTPTPKELEIKLTKLTNAIIKELLLPDILVVQEVENEEMLQKLGTRVNDAEGTDYQAVSFETSDARGIEVGFLYNANSVGLLDAYQMAGEDVEAAFGPGSQSPGREPLVGKFIIQGKEVTIIGNHFKSKGGDDPLFGINQPPLRVTEVQRKAQARVVRDFVEEILAVNPWALLIVTGDLNDFGFGEPDEGCDHPLAILTGTGLSKRLYNLIDIIPKPWRYTYIYDGNSQVLDHMLVSHGVLYRLVGADILHFNAVYPVAYSSDPNTVIRCSDHDPIEIRFYRFW